MKPEIKLLELFSGIGGFSLGLLCAGFNIQKHWFSEVDKHCIANYKYNFPNAEYIGSVTNVRGSGTIQPDIITFGSPCQDFSMAGNGKGLEGQKSVLILEAIRIIRECRPSVFIWENVKGAFSTNDGADFWAIIAAFTNIGGYRLEWQLLNTSWFLPQNRERIYLVGHLAGRSEPRVFPIRETDFIHNKAKSKKSSEVASTLNANDNKSWVGNFIKKGNFEFYGSGQDQKLSPLDRLSQTVSAGHFNQPKIKVNPVQPGQSNQTFAAQYGTQIGEGDAFTIRASQPNGVKIESGIRRLTEIECERLQGFDKSWLDGSEPANWTKYGNYDGVIKEIPKTQRYKMCGNAVTVDVVECIGKRLLQ